MGSDSSLIYLPSRSRRSSQGRAPLFARVYRSEALRAQTLDCKLAEATSLKLRSPGPPIQIFFSFAFRHTFTCPPIWRFVVFLVRLAIVRGYTAPFKSSLEPFNSVALQGTLNHLIGHDGLYRPPSTMKISSHILPRKNDWLHHQGTSIAVGFLPSAGFPGYSCKPILAPRRLNSS
jgi:hypothetical protein